MLQTWQNPLACTSEPHELFPHVVEFCNAIASESAPVFLPLEADLGDEIANCPSNVGRRIERSGGDAVLGWSIWEWHGVMIEAEFHMVWRDTNGVLHDVTPKPAPLPRILFLPDPRMTYRDQQINNIRRALLDDGRLKEFIETTDKEFAIMNRGERAKQHGAVEFTREEFRELQRLQDRKTDLMRQILSSEPGRNDFCRCGSAKTWKDCHGF